MSLAYSASPHGPHKGTQAHRHTHRHTGTQAHRHTHTHTQSYRHTGTHRQAHTHTHTHTHTVTEAHRHTHIHTHTGAQKHTSRRSRSERQPSSPFTHPWPQPGRQSHLAPARAHTEIDRERERTPKRASIPTRTPTHMQACTYACGCAGSAYRDGAVRVRHVGHEAHHGGRARLKENGLARVAARLQIQHSPHPSSRVHPQSISRVTGEVSGREGHRHIRGQPCGRLPASSCVIVVLWERERERNHIYINETPCLCVCVCVRLRVYVCVHVQVREMRLLLCVWWRTCFASGAV
jgi:hypothetical protein